MYKILASTIDHTSSQAADRAFVHEPIYITNIILPKGSKCIVSHRRCYAKRIYVKLFAGTAASQRCCVSTECANIDISHSAF